MDKKLQILIVDDDSVNRMAVSNLLQEYDTEILEADNGETALQIIKNKHVDVIFMDILMPDMDGITTTRYIRELENNNKRIKIIATSGSNIEEREQYIAIYQFDDIIMKPLDSNKIKDCLEQWFFVPKNPSLAKSYCSELAKGNMIKEYFGHLEELDLAEGLKYAHYSTECYMRVIKTSVKQMKDTTNTISDLLLESNYKQIYFQLHSIKSVFFYVGARELAEITNQYESLFSQRNGIESNFNTSKKRLQDFQIFIHRITVFCNELEQAIQAYYSSIKNEFTENYEPECSIEEINRLIEKIMLHVYRFEYNEIMNGLKSLERIVQSSSKQYILQAIAATEEFDYDKVKTMLVGCWNEIND